MAQTKVNIGSGTGGIGIASYGIKGIITITDSNTVIDQIAENLNSQAYVQELIAVNGLNTIPIPNKANGVVVVPLKDADQSFAFRGTGGAATAANHTFHPKGPFILSFPSPTPANLYLNWPGVSWWDTAVTATNATDVINLVAHGIANGTVVYLNSAVAMPDTIQALFPYYVVAAAANTFQLALTSGGAAVLFGTDGVSLKLSTMSQYKLFWV